MAGYKGNADLPAFSKVFCDECKAIEERVSHWAAAPPAGGNGDTSETTH
jgi:hypothetical protein